MGLNLMASQIKGIGNINNYQFRIIYHKQNNFMFPQFCYYH